MSDDDWGNDLDKGLDALIHVLEGIVELQRVTMALVEKADGAFGHQSERTTIGRLIGVGLVGAIAAVKHDVQTAATGPRTDVKAPEPANTSAPSLPRCRTHGVVPWKGTIVYRVCCRAYQLLDCVFRSTSPPV